MERIFIISSQRENRQCLQLYHVMNSSNNPGPHKLENNYTKMLHPADAGCSCPASICFCLFPLVKTITKTGRHSVPPLQHPPYLHLSSTIPNAGFHSFLTAASCFTLSLWKIDVDKNYVINAKTCPPQVHFARTGWSFNLYLRTPCICYFTSVLRTLDRQDTMMLQILTPVNIQPSAQKHIINEEVLPT